MSPRALAVLALAALVPATAHADCTSTPTLCGLPVTSTIEEPDLDQAIDVVVVGDGYTDAASWTAAATSAIATFRGQGATGLYGTVPGLYNFHVVQVLSATTDVSDADLTDTALGMNVSGAYITSDASRVATAALNAPDVDIIIAIANGGGRANANYPTQLASGGSIRLGTSFSPISHEMGHAAIHLADEYVEVANCRAPNEASLLFERNVTTDPTCAKFSTTPGAACIQGGKYCSAGVYRSAPGCLMATSGATPTCPVCRRAVREVLLEKQTGLDAAEPWAVVTNPAQSATVAGTINLTALLYDDFFLPTTVAFSVDGVFRRSVVATGTFAQVAFDTTQLTDGSHTVEAFPDDVAGHAGRSVPVTFQTENFVAPAPITLALQTPLDGATLSGKTFVNGSATLPTPTWLALLLDGTPVAMQANSRFLGFNWDTTTASSGAHTLQLMAADRREALYGSPVVNVTVSQATDGGAGRPGGSQDPFIFVFSPTSWSAVGPLFLLRYSVANAPGGATPELWVDQRQVLPNPLPALSMLGGAVLEAAQSALIDAGGWSLGPHEVEVRLPTARSGPIVLVRVAPATNPVTLLVSPRDGAWVRGQQSVAARAYDDVSVSSISLLVDGVATGAPAASPATFSWNTTLLADGLHRLVAEAVDGAGNRGQSEVVSVSVDNTPPLASITSPSPGATVPASLFPVMVSAVELGSGTALVELLVDGQVKASALFAPAALAAVLSPGPHTLRARATDRAGNTALSAAVAVTAGDCSGGSCDDGRACTTDLCGTSGACLHLTTPDCCATGADCDDGNPCTTDSCGGSLSCVHTAVAGCCAFGAACGDGTLCTLDRCSAVGGTCSHPDAGCCASAADCNDGNSCTVDDCLSSGWCVNDWNGACCRSDPDCDDGDDCTSEVCSMGACVRTPVAGCCNANTDCDDGVLCTWNQCSNHSCSFPPRAGCCSAPADCASLNTCQMASCVSNVCQASLAPNCCTFDFECADADPCTLDRCQAATCVHLAMCCSSSAQCNDLRPCTADSCDADAGVCNFTTVPGCCETAADCDDLDVCTTDTCAANACSSASIAGCCHTAADCDDGRACTVDDCVANACTHQDGCCTTAAQCDDGDVCTTDGCDGGACGATRIDGCCRAASDCDDGDACTDDLCTANTCGHLNRCCVSAADCDDGNLCTSDGCDAGSCGHAAQPGCCTSDGDCTSPQACDQYVCVDPSPQPLPMPPEVVVGSCGCDGVGGLGIGLGVLALVASKRRRRRGG